MTSYGKLYSRKVTPQLEPIPGSTQVQNAAGGFAWTISDWARLDRFLVLGAEGGSYYATERALTRENAQAVERCVTLDAPRVVARTVEISEAGRAPKNDPAIFVLAMASKLGDLAGRRAALEALPRVCRTGTHLMHFAEYVQAFGGWGRGTRSAVARWYNAKPVADLAYQVVKYQSRDGWSNRDVLRLAHPKGETPAHDFLYRWIVSGRLAPAQGLELVGALEELKAATSMTQVVSLLQDFDLPRECVPTKWLAEAAVWDALLERMPVTAMIRNLATMTRVGLIAPLAESTALIVKRLGDEALLRAARVHPIAVLAALVTYQSGHGVRGKSSWRPVPAITDALDGAFYATFQSVEPTGKRSLLALDVSGSMGAGAVAGVPGFTPRVASAAMALVTAATEARHAFVSFQTELTPLSISPRQRLDEVVRTMDGLPFGGTDCSLPIVWALEQRLEVDTFVVFTDSETWAGKVHPAQALRAYRQAMGLPAKLIVVGMVSSGFTIADPNDAGMLDVVGFDTATPLVMSDFAKQ
jgi:60 kDa SS-A/Ro ribonucleoprotein